MLKGEPRPLPPLEVLRERLAYDPSSGIIRWRSRSRNGGGRAVVGDEAGYAWSQGYRTIFLGGHLIPAHRIAWALVHGEDPRSPINHLNGDKGDNRIANLRLATKSEYTRSAKPRKTNTSGVPGVGWNSRMQRWVARVCVDGGRIHLGSYERFVDAVAARRRGEAKHYGEFAPKVAA